MEGEKPSDELLRYFIWIFMVQKDYEAAQGLLQPIITEKMGHGDLTSDDVFLLPHWQKEFCAHLVAVQVPGEKYADYTVPLRLLEGISYDYESSAALNHATLLETNYKYDEALTLLNAISEVSDDEKKSLCKFRRGRIFLEIGDKESAFRNLEEAVKLDPSNLNARLLFRDLNSEGNF
jgi:tetratricopeptide (TPR) repeat protein